MFYVKTEKMIFNENVSDLRPTTLKYNYLLTQFSITLNLNDTSDGYCVEKLTCQIFNFDFEMVDTTV